MFSAFSDCKYNKKIIVFVKYLIKKEVAFSSNLFIGFWVELKGFEPSSKHGKRMPSTCLSSA